MLLAIIAYQSMNPNPEQICSFTYHTHACLFDNAHTIVHGNRQLWQACLLQDTWKTRGSACCVNEDQQQESADFAGQQAGLNRTERLAHQFKINLSCLH